LFPQFRRRLLQTVALSFAAIDEVAIAQLDDDRGKGRNDLPGDPDGAASGQSS
jgi:hypothetical protein